MVSEGATLMVALSAIRKGAKEANMPLYEYGMYAPTPIYLSYTLSSKL